MRPPVGRDKKVKIHGLEQAKDSEPLSEIRRKCYDLKDRMLEQANKKVSLHGWNNVELVLADAAAFAFPAGVNGVLSTFALPLMPDYDRTIRTGRGLIILHKLSNSTETPHKIEIPHIIQPP